VKVEVKVFNGWWVGDRHRQRFWTSYGQKCWVQNGTDGQSWLQSIGNGCGLASKAEADPERNQAPRPQARQ